MSIKSAHHAVDQCRALREQAHNLCEAAEMLLMGLEPESRVKFTEGMEYARKYQEAYHVISESQRKLFCIENILDPQDDVLNELEEVAKMKTEREKAGG